MKEGRIKGINGIGGGPHDDLRSTPSLIRLQSKEGIREPWEMRAYFLALINIL